MGDCCFAEIAKDALTPEVVGNTPRRQADLIYSLMARYTYEKGSAGLSFEFDLRRGLKDGTGQNEGYSIQRTSATLINTVTTGEIQGDVATRKAPAAPWWST